MLYRGEYDKRRDPVKADTPAMLPPMPAEFPKNRLGLAKWLVRPENPLTARVTVNRFWQQLFGEGIVRTTGDFGMTGEAPSHQELLDWLAVDFRESGWDIKKCFRLIVTSATYRQAATVTPDKLEKDPSNRLLSRGPRFRMDAEMIRDYALAASGLLSPKIGGPSVRPYQPPGVWEAVAMPNGNLSKYEQDHGDSLYRRSMYTFWKRSAPPASMEIFNAPTREACTIRRDRTDTPLQALVTLNDTQFIEAARILAELALKDGGSTPDARLDFIARRLLARPLRPEELGGREIEPCRFVETLSSRRRRRHETDGRRRDESGCVARSANARRLDDALQRVDEPRRSAEQIKIVGMMPFQKKSLILRMRRGKKIFQRSSIPISLSHYPSISIS